MPKANIENALKKATGALTGGSGEAQLDTVTYEGLGPGGIACMVETLTNNRSRTNALVRHAFTKRGGVITPVQYLFARRGRLVFKGGSGDVDLERMEDEAIGTGFVEDIGEADEESGTLEVFTDLGGLLSAKKELEGKGFSIEKLEIAWVPKEKVELPDADSGALFGEMIEVLEELADVVRVDHNAA